MGMKKTDYTVTRGTEKREYNRGCKINDKSTNLCVVLVLNYKKGFYHIVTKWSAEQITGELTDDAATLKTLSELAMQASIDGEAWKREWHDAQPKDPSQSEMFEDGESPESDSLNVGFKEEE